MKKTINLIGMLIIVLITIQGALGARVDCDGSEVGYDSNVFNVSLSNGWYFSDGNCQGSFYQYDDEVLDDSGFFRSYNGSDSQSGITNYVFKNMSCSGKGVITCCTLKEGGTGINLFDICQNVSKTDNGGVQVHRTLELINTDWQYENFTMQFENRAFSNALGDLFYIPTRGWRNVTGFNELKYPFDNTFMPATIQANISHPYYLVYGTKANHAYLRYGGTNNFDFAQLKSDGTYRLLSEYEQDYYYYVGDLALTSNSTKNDLNKLVVPALKKFVEWYDDDFYNKNLSFVDGMTTWSHWCYPVGTYCDNLFSRSAEIGYTPSFAKYYTPWSVQMYSYTNEPPESWGWEDDRLYNAWIESTNDDSILILNSGLNPINDTTYSGIKVNIGYDNASNYWINILNESYVNITEFIFFDNHLDTLHDYAPQAVSNSSLSPLNSNLRLSEKLRDLGYYQQGGNGWNHHLASYKYLSFMEIESTAAQYGLGREYATSQQRYRKILDGLRLKKYMTNPPLIEFFSQIIDVDQNTGDYDRIAGILTAQAKMHDGTVNYNWDDDDNGNYNLNSSYIIVRYHKNLENAPRIYSECTYVNDSYGTIPLGHSLQINITSVPCIITTTADYYQLDNGEINTISAGSFTLDGMDAESMHDLKVWDSKFLITQKSGANILYSYKITNDVSMQLYSPHAYPYGESGSTATLEYEGTYRIIDSNTGNVLCSDSPCTFPMGITRNITATYFSSPIALKTLESEESLCEQSFQAFELVAIALIALVAVSMILFLKGSDVDWITMVITLIVVSVFIMISIKIISSVVGTGC